MTTEVDEHSKVAIIGKSDLAHGVLGSSKGALASGVFGSNSYHPPIRRDEVGILAPPKDDPRHEVGLLAPPKGYPGSGVLGVHSGDSGGSGVRGDSSAGYGVHGSSEAPNHSGVLGIHELRKGQTIKYPSYGVFGFQIGNVRGAGVRGESSSGDGVIGVTHSEKKNGVVGIIETGPGSMNIESITFGLGNGVAGFSSAPDASGVWGFGRAAGVSGTSNEGHGVHGLSNTVLGIGVFGENKAPLAFSADLSHVAPVGVTGLSEHGIGVRGESFYQDYLTPPAPAHSDVISGVWDDKPSTKQMVSLLGALGATGKKVLILTDGCQAERFPERAQPAADLRDAVRRRLDLPHVVVGRGARRVERARLRRSRPWKRSRARPARSRRASLAAPRRRSARPRRLRPRAPTRTRRRERPPRPRASPRSRRPLPRSRRRRNPPARRRGSKQCRH